MARAELAVIRFAGAVRRLIFHALLGVFLALGGASALAHVPDRVVVHLFEAQPPFSAVYIEGPFELSAPYRRRFGSGWFECSVNDGRLLLNHLSGRASASSLSASAFLVIGHGPRGLGLRLAGRPVHHYRGALRMLVDDRGNLVLFNEVKTRDYIVSVVGSETPPSWPAEALKAQAILTQTGLTRYKPDDPLGDSTQKEVYLGSDHERPEVEAAVATVFGRVLTHGGQAVTPFYHSTCAGATSDGARYFGRKPADLPYLSGVKCRFCRPSPFSKETKHVVPASEFKRAFMEGVPRIVARDGAGRPLEVEFAGGRHMSGYAFWIKLGQRLGWDKVPGTRFDLDDTAAGVGLVSTGAGHGVGMCQWGAAGLARSGKRYNQILEYYFAGCRVR